MNKILFFIAASMFFIQSCSDDAETSMDRFDNISASEILESEGLMSDDLINSTIGESNEIPMNTILTFRTGDGNYGKMIILNNTVEDDVLQFAYELFDNEINILVRSSITTVRRTFTFDFETNVQGAPSQDFWWEWNELNNGGQDGEDKFIVPRDNCIFAIYNR